MLESLGPGAGTIHELNLVGAFPERAVYRPRELYAALKETPLYDAERGQWNDAMTESQVLRDTRRYSNVLLLGVLMETQVNPDGARVLYEKLKGTALYEPERGQWNWDMSPEQTHTVTSRDACPQLLGVLVEGQFNLVRARRMYDLLKTTPLYDSALRQWNCFMSQEQELFDRRRFVDTQLIGVLAEALFDPESARGLYETLKVTPLYDHGRGQWNRHCTEEQILQDSCRYADAQLLGVLVEAQFDPEAARKRYEELKATPLYDAERTQWNWYMSGEQQLRNTDRCAGIQLLGVLVEAKLLSTLRRPLAEVVPPLPIMEAW